MATKTYEPPRILVTEKIITRASTCAKTDESCRTNGGPIVC